MEIYQRITLLRTDILKNSNNKKFSQEKFAKLLGVSKGVINNIERNDAPVKDHIIKLICQTFNVNEEWLRNGTEPIFIEKDDEPLIDLIQKEFDLSPLSKKIVNSYLNLNKQDRVVFERFFTNLLDEISNDDTINLDVKPQLKLIGFGGDNETKELNQEQANLNINNLDIEDNNL